MEFIDNDLEEEKEELSNELVASLKKKITTLEEQIAELHLAVYDQQDDCRAPQGHYEPVEALRRGFK
jgi:chaperonin cofactor prefoldin